MSLCRVSSNRNRDGLEATDIVRVLEHRCSLPHLLSEFLLDNHVDLPDMPFTIE